MVRNAAATETINHQLLIQPLLPCLLRVHVLTSALQLFVVGNTSRFASGIPIHTRVSRHRSSRSSTRARKVCCYYIHYVWPQLQSALLSSLQPQQQQTLTLVIARVVKKAMANAISTYGPIKVCSAN